MSDVVDAVVPTDQEQDDSSNTDRIDEKIKSAIEENNKQWQDKISEVEDKTNKAWQSRFDKLRAEKDEEIKEKETWQQKVDRIEREREQERIVSAREKAMAKSGIDEDIFTLADKIASNDIEDINAGVNGLVDWLNNKVDALATEKYNKAIDEKTKEIKPPKGGESLNLDAEIEKAQKAGNMTRVVQLRRKQREGN